MIDGTKTEPCERVLIRLDIHLGALKRDDAHLFFLNTITVELAERPITPVQRREHGIARVIYTWLRIENADTEAMAADIETLAALGRSEKWKNAIRTWAHVARTDPDMFHQQATFTNYAAGR